MSPKLAKLSVLPVFSANCGAVKLNLFRQKMKSKHYSFYLLWSNMCLLPGCINC